LVNDFDEPSIEDFSHNLKFLLGHISGTRELLALTDLGVYGRPNLAGVAPEEGAQLLGSRDDSLGCLVVFNILGEFSPSRLVVVVFHKNHSCFGALDDFLLPVFFFLPSSFVRVWYRVINKQHWDIFFFFFHPSIDSYGILRVHFGRRLAL
jgi:hypothetical protein